MGIWDNIKQRAKDTCDEVKKEIDKQSNTPIESVGNDEQERSNHGVVEELRKSGIPVIDVHDAKEAFEKAAEPMEGERPLDEKTAEKASKSASDYILGLIETASASLNSARDSITKTGDQATKTAKETAEKASDSVKENVEGHREYELPSWLQKAFGVRTLGEGIDAVKAEVNPSNEKEAKKQSKDTKKDSEPRFCGMSLDTLNKLKVVRIIHAKEDGTTLIRIKGLPVAYILDGESFKDTGKWAWKISQKVFLSALKQQTKKHTSGSVSDMVGNLFKKK